MKEVLKWGLIIIGAWFLLRFVGDFLENTVNIGDGSIWPGAAYAPPITAPATPVYGWIPPWQIPYLRRGRGRRR